VIDRSMNGAAFRAYVEHILAPTLSPGDIVAADNLQCHKAPGVREAIEARGAELRLLPAYSPDLNPIKQVFAKLKALIRAEAPRSVETLWTTIAACLGHFTATECGNYFANSGYPRLM
jgi:transposase